MGNTHHTCSCTSLVSFALASDSRGVVCSSAAYAAYQTLATMSGLNCLEFPSTMAVSVQMALEVKILPAMPSEPHNRPPAGDSSCNAK
jgi:hypothetical protein